MAELSVATSEERDLCDAETFPEWGSGLSLPQYRDRQRRLRETAWEREGGRDWVLREGPAVVSSCSTYRLLNSIGIGNVFTPERYRQRGHATTLMKLLMERLERETAALEALFLFSDIDPKFYERLGFGARPARDRIWEPLAEGDPTEGVEPIPLNGVAGLRLSRERFPPTPLLIAPTRESLDWQLERERIYSALLGRARPLFQGARLGLSEALWTVEYKYASLTFIYLDTNDAHAAELFVRSARRLAGRLGLKQVRAWEEQVGATWPKALGGRREARPSSVPMVRPLRSGVFPKHWAWAPRGIWV